MSSKPKCIIVTGRPGSGKTSLSKRLAERLWMPVISRDEIKEGYVNTHGVKHDQLPPDTNGVVSNFFFEIVNQYLAGKISVVIEAAFQHKVWEPRMPRSLNYALLSLSSAPLTGWWRLSAISSGVWMIRIGSSTTAISALKSTGKQESCRLPGDYTAPNFNVPTVHVSTEGQYSPSIDDIVQRIRLLNAQHDGEPNSN